MANFWQKMKDGWNYYWSGIGDFWQQKINPSQPIPSETINENSSLSDIYYYNNYHKNDVGFSPVIPNYNIPNISSPNNSLNSTLGSISSILGGVGSIGSSIFNFINQNKQLDYQKKLQQQIFNREDTATQRKVEDLRKAGLSPNIAIGSPSSSGAVVSTSAPQFNSPDLDFISNIQHIQGIKNMELQNTLLRAQILSSLSRIDGINLDNELKRYTNDTMESDKILKYIVSIGRLLK